MSAYPTPYPPPPPQPVTVVVAPPQPRFTKHPAQMECPHCHAQIVTQTEFKPGVLAWGLAGGLCLLGLFWGCCLIPLFVEGCHDVKHYCPNCNYHLGTWKRI